MAQTENHTSAWHINIAKLILIAFINIEGVFLSAYLNDRGACGFGVFFPFRHEYDLGILPQLFEMQSYATALFALVLLALKHHESAKIFTLLNVLAVAGGIVSVLPYKLGCII
jgi:hypothetical protein